MYVDISDKDIYPLCTVDKTQSITNFVSESGLLPETHLITCGTEYIWLHQVGDPYQGSKVKIV